MLNPKIGEYLRMRQLLEGKTALITGANRGIGLATATLFAAHGARIIATMRREERELGELIASEAGCCPSNIRVLNLDLSDLESIKNITSTLISEGSEIQILVNNAGYATGSRVQLTSKADIECNLQINYVGPMILTQRLLRLMTIQTKPKQSASIINVSTSAVSYPGVGMAAYSASKSAMEQASKVLAKEISKSGIRVNTICPGPVQTEMLEKMDLEHRNKLIESTWMQRSADPSEIASVALFLASDLSSYITGQSIHVDGGLG